MYVLCGCIVDFPGALQLTAKAFKEGMNEQESSFKTEDCKCLINVKEGQICTAGLFDEDNSGFKN